jgi:hypothetical protein
MGDTPSDDEEEEVEESFWGDEIVEKWGSFKSVLPAATVTGAAAFVQRESKAVLLFKDLAASIPGEEPVLVFVSWEPAKKVSVRAWMEVLVPPTVALLCITGTACTVCYSARRDRWCSIMF